MTDAEKQGYYKANRVITVHGRFSDTSVCGHNGCTNPERYLIFVGQDTRLSTLYTQSCEHCLSQVMDKSIQYSIAEAEKMIKRHEEREIEQARRLLAAKTNDIIKGNIRPHKLTEESTPVEPVVESMETEQEENCTHLYHHISQGLGRPVICSNCNEEL